jgi:hypothetical protein
MKLKHNKKRNTAFLYEALVKELTKSIVHGNKELKEGLMLTMREYFSPGKPLRNELDLVKALSETKHLDLFTAERLLNEAKAEHSKLDKKEIFNEQTAMIGRINKFLGADVFSNFVPNYKHLATIHQIFSDRAPVKSRVLLERTVIGSLTSKPKAAAAKTEMPHMDKLVYKKVIENFNAKYDGELLTEQKNLINKFIVCTGARAMEFRVYLNEEIGRLKEEVSEAKDKDVFQEDSELSEKMNLVSEALNKFQTKKIDQTLIHKVMQIQQLVKELLD